MSDGGEQARVMLRDLSTGSLAALKALQRGTVAEVSLRRGFSGLLPGTSPGRIVTGRLVYKLGARASELGISEDGILGITDNGELVRMSRWLPVEGQRPIDPRGQSRRFRDRLARKAKSLGCEGLMSVTAIEAHGEPQRETRFNREYKSVFYLDATGKDATGKDATGKDATGKLVFGHPGSVIGAEEWFNKALLT
jgi:hypothetical protein